MANITIVSHPSNEPKYGWAKRNSRIRIPWNTGSTHCRKFIRRSGQYLRNGVLEDGELFFWGEYEPESECMIMGKQRPKAVHYNLTPVRGSNPIPPKALNTDPYVFGNHFKYICCGMRGRTYNLGDVVLFGKIESCNTKFYLILDTVFVIQEKVCVDYTMNTSQYYKASIEPLGGKKTYFYRGVNYTSNHQYYSFVPCLLSYSNQPRPYLDLTSLGFTVNKRWHTWKASSVPFTNDIWEKILKSVTQADWMIGTHVCKV